MKDSVLETNFKVHAETCLLSPFSKNIYIYIHTYIQNHTNVPMAVPCSRHSVSWTWPLQVAAAFDHAHRALLCPWAIASPSSRGASKCPKNEFCRAESGWSFKGLGDGWIKVEKDSLRFKAKFTGSGRGVAGLEFGQFWVPS